MKYAIKILFVVYMMIIMSSCGKDNIMSTETIQTDNTVVTYLNEGDSNVNENYSVKKIVYDILRGRKITLFDESNNQIIQILETSLIWMNTTVPIDVHIDLGGGEIYDVKCTGLQYDSHDGRKFIFVGSNMGPLSSESIQYIDAIVQ